MSGHTLYTMDMLGAAAGLAAFPLVDDLPLRGAARSATCGSTLSIGLALDTAGRIARVGLAPRACAVGQAAAFAFASAALGRSASDIRAARQAIAGWLAHEEAPMPDWPGLEIIAPARSRPGRHGAVLLAWDAAIDALAGLD